MEKDLVSILIPAYNVEKYLGRCLNSVIKQTYQNLEIIVVDDGSTDNTYSIAKKYADSDSRIVLLQKENQNNIALTRNFLLDHCHGKYFVWVDSDDYVKPNYVEKLYKAIVTHEADLSTCGFVFRLIKFPILPQLYKYTRVYQDEDLVSRVIYKSFVTLWNKMYKTDLVNQGDPIRFDPKYCYGEDLLFNIYYSKRCKKITRTNQRLYAYSVRAGSTMRKKFSEKHFAFVDKLLDLCKVETNPVVQKALRSCSAVTCCGAVFLADKRKFAKDVARVKPYAYLYRNDLYKNRLANFSMKFVLWLGLKTWCRPDKKLKNTIKNSQKG